MRTYECARRPSRHRQPFRREGSPSGLDQLASSIGDAVERLIRSLDQGSMRGEAPGWRRRGWYDDDEPCPTCGKHYEHHEHHDHEACCDRCCDHPHHDHHHDHHHEHHRHRCGPSDCCEPRCGRDECHCTCCIGDADVVVYTRVGETRVIPITFENQRRREREIELDLGPFTTKGGSPSPVDGRLVTPARFTLEPCSVQDAVLVVAVGRTRPEPVPVPGEPAGVPGFEPSGGAADLRSSTKSDLLERARELGITGAASMTKDQLVAAIGDATPVEPIARPPREIPDVDDCHVAVADLRVQGCDTRPIRIAVAVLPRDCGSYEVHCGCGCC